VAGGCRDCRTCTQPWLLRITQNLMVGLMYLCTVGVAWLFKRGLMRHCPQCGHLRGRHEFRRDGSYKD
jgi:hypothetical protein